MTEDVSLIFFASNSYNGGAEDFNGLIQEKNTHFWNDCVDNNENAYDLKSFESKNNVRSEKIEEELTRTQPNHVADDDKLKSLIASLEEIYKQLIKENAWYAFKIESYYVNEKHSMIGFYKKTAATAWEKYDNTKLFLLNNKHKAKDLIREVRINMYHTNPSEGAW